MTAYNPRARRWPCCDCGKAYAAMRPDTRCPDCSQIRGREHTAARNRRFRAEIGARERQSAEAAARATATDPAIALYRRERAARDERRQRETDAVNAVIDETRELLYAETTAKGGGKLRKDGSKRSEKYARKVA